jgi:NADH-quinone oxidoreductase subunit G
VAPGDAPVPPAAAPAVGSENGALRLGTYRPIWAAPEVEISPSLQFLVAEQQVELSPLDAESRSLAHGETVAVTQNGTRLRATVAVRTGVPAGTVFLAEGLARDSANVFTESTVELAPWSEPALVSSEASTVEEEAEA